MESSSITNYIKQKYPQIVLSKQDVENGLRGFVLSEDKATIGVMNSAGKMFILGNTKNIEFLLKKNINEIFKKVPEIIVSKDKVGDISKILRNTEQIDSRINSRIIDFLSARMESQTPVVNYKVLYDTQNKEFINIKQKYVDKIDEITKKYNISVEKLEQCKNIIINQKESIIKSINDYKREVTKYVGSKNMKINELQALYEKAKDEKKQIQDKLDELLVLYQKENDKKSQSERVLKESEAEIAKLKKDNVQLAEREEEIQRLKGIIDEHVNTIKEKQDEINSLRLDQENYKQKEMELKVIKEELDKIKVSVEENEREIASLKVSMEGVVGGDEKVRERERELEELRKKLEEQNKLYEEKRIELDKLRGEFSDKEKVIEDYEREIEKLKLSADESNKSLQKMLDENKIEIADLKEQIEQNLKKIKEKEDEIDTLKKSIAMGVSLTPKDFEEKIKEKEKEIEDLKRTYSQGDVILKEKEKEILELRDKLKSNEEQLSKQKRELEVLTGSSKKSSDELLEMIKEKEGEIIKLNKRLEEVGGDDSKRIIGLEATIKEKEIEVSALKMSLDKTKGELDELIKAKGGEIGIKMKEKGEIEEKLLNSEREIKDLKKQVEKYGLDIKKLEETIKGKTSEIAKLNDKLKDAEKNLKDKIEEKEKEINVLKDRLKSGDDWGKQLEDKENQIKGVRDEMKRVKEELEGKIVEKEKEIVILKEKLGMSSKELEQAILEKEKEIKGLDSEIKKRSKDLEGGIEKKEDEIDSLTKRLERVTKEYEEKLKSKQDQLDKLQEKMDNKVEEMQKKIEEKEKELEVLKKTLSEGDFKKVILEKEDEIKRLTSELKSVTTKMQDIINEKEKEIARLNQSMVSKTEGMEKTIVEKEKDKESLDKTLDETTRDLRRVVEEKEKEIIILSEKLNKVEVELKGQIKEKDNEIASLTGRLSEKEKEYQRIISEKDNEIRVLKDASGKTMDALKTLSEKQKELAALHLKIKTSTDELKKKVSDRELEIAELKKRVSISDKGVDEKELEIRRLTELVKATNIKKDEEINVLRKNIDDIQKELNTFKDELSKTKLQNALLEGYRKRCKEKFIRDKDTIIKAIKEYKDKWILWSRTVKGDVLSSDSEKKKLFNELNKIKETLQMVMKDKDLLSDDYGAFKQSANEIKAQLEKTISEQIIELNKRDERIKTLEKYQTSQDTVALEEKNRTIEKLQRELAEVRRLLAQNDATKIQVNVNCDNALKNFCSLNNIFFRKVEIIKKLDEIIKNNLGIFTNLDDTIKADITRRFEDIKASIMKHIDFLNLKKYINDQTCRQYLEYLKKESTRSKVPVEFCNQMVDLLDYWNLNKMEYREQDRLLTNIYEDLSGAVRVYIRIKPLVGSKTDVVTIKSFEGKRTKSVVINCKGSTSEFGEFYGVFDDTFSNIDLYTGVKGIPLEGKYNVNIDGIVENTESINPGLYSVFKQAEDGYSIVLFGYGLSGSGKCMGKDTPILMYDGTIKMIQDVKIGDFLMGDDSSPRRVLSLARGRDIMYKVTNIKDESYIVNSEHILSLKASINKKLIDRRNRNSYVVKVFNKEKLMIESFSFSYKNKLKNEIYNKAKEFFDKIQDDLYVDIPIKKYLSLSSFYRENLRGYKVAIDFPHKDIEIDPYMIGYWLGDGHSNTSCITTQDACIIKYFKTNLVKYGCYLQYHSSQEYIYRINGSKSNGVKGGNNYFLNVLKQYDLINNKHIPHIYKCNSRENRLKLLAGLLDSDGSYDSKKNIFEFSQSKNKEKLIDDVIYLCRSLGFGCYKNNKKTSWTYNGVKKYGEAWRICISGDGIETIPTLCIRKKAKPRRQIKDVLVSGINIERLEEDEYYGFEIDGNHRYVLDNFTVTHNTFSLLGSQSTPGLIHYGFSNLQGVKNIKLKYLFEQYFSLVNVNFGKLTGKIHNLIREVPQLGSVSKNETEQFRMKIPGDINVDDLRVDQFNKLTDIITSYRKERGRIKKTPNNDESSRSHLFMVFEVSFVSGKKGYISVIDMAGRESPTDIFDTFIDSSRTKLASVMSPSGEVSLIRKTLRAGLNYTPENVFEILKESFYINETINHLIYYFNKKNFKYTKPILQVGDIAKYDVSRYYVKPQDEEEVVKFNVGNNCLMIPILKFLEGLSSKGSSSWLPTKFITIVAVREEEKYCTQTLETLQFAQSIKSS